MRPKAIRLALFLAGIILSASRLGLAEDPPAASRAGARIRSIGSILITVANVDRSIEFYSHVLTFQKMTDTELAGEQVEQLF